MSPLQRLAALAVTILVALAAVLLAVRGADPVGVAPSAAPTASATSEPSPSASRAPAQTPDGDSLAIFREIEEAVIAIRGLPAAEIGPPEIISRDELQVELEQLFEEDYSEEERRRDNATLRALGLLDEGQDVAELQLQLLGDQVLGFYDDTEKRMVVVSDGGLDAQGKLTYAHEYTHALQDAAFGLDSLETDAVGEDDQSMARLALIEGDATATMLAWAIRALSQQELLELQDTPIPDTSGVPGWMIATLEFPYLAGPTWVTQVGGGDPFDLDFDAIDDAYADAPDSTEQILDFEKWLDREQPVPVELPDLAGALGDDWVEIESTSIGQASIAITLEHFGIPPAEAAAAAEGWGGDRLVVAVDPNDAFAAAWILAWDQPADAGEFVDAYGEVIRALPFPAEVLELDGGEVLVAHAADEGLLRRTVEAARGR
ncbi:MAG: hypothetical protein ACRDGV_13555 [Candidatus Limnocylindria bacterium]